MNQPKKEEQLDTRAMPWSDTRTVQRPVIEYDHELRMGHLVVGY